MKAVVVFLLVACAGAARAQGGDPQALAAAIDRHYNALKTLQVHFVQRYQGMGLDRTESGTLLLSRSGPRMRWTYAQPAGKLFVLDGRDAYFYTPGTVEVPRVPAKKLDDLRTPLAFLLGHASLAKQLGGMRLKPGAEGGATLTGVPRGMEKRVAEVEITAGADGTIARIVVEETDGVRNELDLSSEQDGVQAPAAAFVFVPPPGTHVVDGMPPL